MHQFVAFGRRHNYIYKNQWAVLERHPATRFWNPIHKGQVYSFKSSSWATLPPENGWLENDYFPFGDPLFSGKKLTGFVSGRGSPSDAARMAWLVVLVPSRCTEPLRRGARRPTDDPPGERSHFPTNFPDGEVGKIIMYGYPGGYAALNFCCWLYLPVTYLMMWRFVGLVEIFYWLVRDLTIETNPCESHQQEPFPDGHSNSNGWWYRLHRPRTYIWKIWALYRHVYIFTPCRTMHLYMHIHLSNIL